VLGCAVAVFALSGCETLLDVSLPADLTEEQLLQPEMMDLMVTSAIADFECAYSEWTAAVAGFEDTFWESTGWWTRAYSEYQLPDGPGVADCGTIETSAQYFMQFQTARYLAESAYTFLEGEGGASLDNRERLMATAATYTGLIYQMFGESYCAMTYDVGEPLSPDESLTAAVDWFTKAISHIDGIGDYSTPTTPSMEQLALLGRARSHYALGQLDLAAADAEQIEPGFVAYVTRDATVRKRWNQVYQHHTVSKYSTVAGPVLFNGTMVSPGYRDLTIDPTTGAPTVGAGVADPRVPVFNTGAPGQDGRTIHWIQTKYDGHDANIPVARWAEAQLILAEAALAGGNAGAAVGHVNNLRAVHSLPSYTGAMDPATVMDLIIEERRREFFYEARFHSTKLEHDLWFPEGTGFNHKGLAYGTTTCLPIPDDEILLNPNL
jgi:starch-binding outer membrane protein, SusD/RagB family